MKSLALLLVGGWIIGSLIMFFVATQNFRTVDRVLGRPTPQAEPVLKTVPHETARPLLRHLSSELNRLYFVVWNLAQIALGLGVLFAVARLGLRTETILTIVMIVIVVALLGATPRIISLGRFLDFVPRNPPPLEMPAFWKLHGFYTGLDTLKVVLGIFLAWRLSR